MLSGILLLAAIIAVIAIPVAVLYARQPDEAKRARFLRRAGLAVMALSTLLVGIFAIGEAFDHPGGWKAAGLVAAWVLPLAALGALAWFRPAWSVPLLAALTAAVIGSSAWFAVSPESWRSFENRNGPIRAFIVLVLAAAVAVLGRKRPAIAGALLLVLGIAPIAISSVGSRGGFSSLAVVSLAPVVAGVLYLLAARPRSHPARPARTEAEPRDLPKAA